MARSFFMHNLLVKSWPLAFSTSGCCGLIAVVRWLVVCSDLVAVDKLLWVICCQLVTFWLFGVGFYNSLFCC